MTDGTVVARRERFNGCFRGGQRLDVPDPLGDLRNRRTQGTRQFRLLEIQPSTGAVLRQIGDQMDHRSPRHEEVEKMPE